MALTSRDMLTITNVIDDKITKKIKEIEVTKVEFNELRDIVKELAEAQKRTEERVEELAQAQKRTEERVEELAQAQKRTEERVERLEIAVEKLVEAQRKTEVALSLLTREVKGLSDRIGFSLEDIGRELLPEYLGAKFGVKVRELLPQWFEIKGVGEEVNFYCEGKLAGKEVVVLGESQSRIVEKTIREFSEKFIKIEQHIQKPTFKFVFGFSIHPAASEIAVKHNIILIGAYQLRSLSVSADVSSIDT